MDKERVLQKIDEIEKKIKENMDKKEKILEYCRKCEGWKIPSTCDNCDYKKMRDNFTNNIINLEKERDKYKGLIEKEKIISKFVGKRYRRVRKNV